MDEDDVKTPGLQPVDILQQLHYAEKKKQEFKARYGNYKVEKYRHAFGPALFFKEGSREEIDYEFSAEVQNMPVLVPADTAAWEKMALEQHKLLEEKKKANEIYIDAIIANKTGKATEAQIELIRQKNGGNITETDPEKMSPEDRYTYEKLRAEAVDPRNHPTGQVPRKIQITR